MGFNGPVLLTGAGGCIGAWVLKLLTDKGISAVAYDLSDDKRRPELLLGEDELKPIPWEQGDITDATRLGAVIEHHGIRAIVHLAALQVPFCKADPRKGAAVNVLGTVNVFEAARDAGIEHLTYASSVAAHGIGETTLPPVPPAIGNAIYNAVGVRIQHLPISPEKVLRALRDKAQREQANSEPVL